VTMAIALMTSPSSLSAPAPCASRSSFAATPCLTLTSKLVPRLVDFLKLAHLLLSNPFLPLANPKKKTLLDEKGRSLWIARPQLPAEPNKRFLIDIVAEDGSRPEGVAPFEVQSMGDVEELKLINNGIDSFSFFPLCIHPCFLR
jgi:hypothetical protein